MENIIDIVDVCKSYPGVRALKGVTFSVQRNSVHCIVGENGAGKSTMIKALTGAERHDSGSIRFHGRPYQPKSIAEAMAAGMSVLYQELNIVDQLTVRENLLLGKETSTFGIVRKGESSGAVENILRSLDKNIKLDSKAGFYSVAQKQIMQIAKAIANESSILIMDEPTASLTDEEIKLLFSIIRDLKEKGVTVIYISHRLEEIFEIGDVVTVLRDGDVVATKDVEHVGSKAELIRLMLGKVVYQTYQKREYPMEAPVLKVSGVSNSFLKNVSFSLYQGEILGFYGLIGSGKTEIARALYGIDATTGSIEMSGEVMRNKTPREAIRAGLSLVPEERRTQGLFPALAIRENISMMNTLKILKGMVTSRKKERALAASYISRLSIATDSMDKAVAYLSGGNQQKVVLSKCVNADARVLMLDEPTRGVDVGAKEEIHKIVRQLADAGTAVMVFSSELTEILNLCDRIVLLCDGEIKGIMQNDRDIDSEAIMHIVTGG